jgi:hypothetical protein
MKKKIYVISYFSLNDQESRVGGHRPFYLFKLLEEKGFEAEFITRNIDVGVETEIKEGFLLRLFKPILRLAAPDFSIFWSIKVFWYIKKKNLGVESKNIVLTTMPPYGVGLSGWLCKIFLKNIFWVVDFRDMWTSNPLYNPPFYKRGVNKFLEDKYHLSADLIVSNTQWDMNIHRSKYPFADGKLIYIRNGFNFVVENKSLHDKQKIKFVYSGGTYKGLATKKISDLLFNLNMIGVKCICEFYGEHDEFMDSSQFISYMGEVRSESIPHLLSNYRVGLLVLPAANQNGGRVAQKFYDYIGSGVIPLCINPSEEMESLINEINFGFVIKDSTPVEEIKDFLLKSNQVMKYEDVLQYTRRAQFENLLKRF